MPKIKSTTRQQRKPNKIKSNHKQQRQFLHDLEDGKVDMKYVESGLAQSPKTGFMRRDITVTAYARAPEDVLERLIEEKIVDSPKFLKVSHSDKRKDSFERRPLFDNVAPLSEERFLFAIQKGWTFAVMPTTIAREGIKYVRAYDAIAKSEEWKEHMSHADCFTIAGICQPDDGGDKLRDHIALTYKYVPPPPPSENSSSGYLSNGIDEFSQYEKFYTQERVRKYAESHLWSAEEALEHARYFANRNRELFREFAEVYVAESKRLE